MNPSEFCQDVTRRDAVRTKPDLNGLDYLEVSEDQLTLTVYFLGKAPAHLMRRLGEEAGLYKKRLKQSVRIEGGLRIRDINVVNVELHQARDSKSGKIDPELDDWMVVQLDRYGDFSTYTLRLVDVEQIDPFYDHLDFTFKIDCPSDVDCLPVDVCAPPALSELEINYLAKDYASFRQLILDRLALMMPDWQERHVPDLGIALVEVLAYLGDHLSYYQDAVATEAYLDTARQRISVRRHARLVDYRMHEGCNARAWVCVETDKDFTLDPRGVYFITGLNEALPVSGNILTDEDLRNLPFSQYEVFEPVTQRPIEFRQAHSTMHFYTWGNRECCLPKGATSATLLDTDDRKLDLHAGDVLIFEEVIGPKTGNPADADPTHRHAVRLTRVTRDQDALDSTPIVKIEWATEDALPFPLCLSAITGVSNNCAYEPAISIARGNVVLVDHGRTVPLEDLGVVPCETTQAECDCEGHPADVTFAPGRYRPRLAKTPLTHRAPFPSRDMVARQQARLLSTVMSRVHDRITALWRKVQGQTLSESELEELKSIFGSQALKKVGLLAPDGQMCARMTGVEQATAIEHLLAHKKQSLGDKTQSPSTVAAQAPYRLAALWQKVQGRTLSQSELDELCVVFGSQAMNEVGLLALDGQECTKRTSMEEAIALQHLLAGRERWLGNKARRVATLQARAQAGSVLHDAASEIAELLGEQYKEGLDPNDCTVLGPASLALLQDAREALPVITLKHVPAAPALDCQHIRPLFRLTDDLTRSIETLEEWVPQLDLLNSRFDEPHFVVEIDNDGRAHVRFGDGELGRLPEAGSSFLATYRVGNGVAGNVGAEAISHLVLRDTEEPFSDLKIRVRNPLPALGGIDPEPMAEAKRFAPVAFRKQLQRAITADDYAWLVHSAFKAQVQRASGVLAWTGSWYEAQVAVDQLGTEVAAPPLLAEIQRHLEQFRRIGHDLAVLPAHDVPLDIEMEVCVLPHYLRGHVEAELRTLFSNRRLPNGRLGFFHPDNLTFGEGVYVSKLVAAAQAVKGVESVKVTTLQRLYEGDHGELAEGVLKLGALEVARLDNDPSFPEHGKLTLKMGGGR